VKSRSEKVIEVTDIEEKWEGIEENERKLGVLCSRVYCLENKGAGNNNNSNGNELDAIRSEQHGNGEEQQVQIHLFRKVNLQTNDILSTLRSSLLITIFLFQFLFL